MFQKGRSGNPAGRKRGVPTKLHREVRAIAARLFDRDYWERKYEELHNGSCHPKIEATLLGYAYGLPAKELHASGTIVHLGPLQALQNDGTIDVTPASRNNRVHLPCA
jgi:hypothetical protein